MKCHVVKNKNSEVAEMRDRGHNRHGPNEGAAVPLSFRWGSCVAV